MVASIRDLLVPDLLAGVVLNHREVILPAWCVWRGTEVCNVNQPRSFKWKKESEGIVAFHLHLLIPWAAGMFLVIYHSRTEKRALF